MLRRHKNMTNEMYLEDCVRRIREYGYILTATKWTFADDDRFIVTPKDTVFKVTLRQGA